VLDFARTARLAEILQGTRLYQADPALFSQMVGEMAARVTCIRCMYPRMPSRR
jgi:hypothetical protein